MEKAKYETIKQNFLDYCKYEKCLSDISIRAYTLDLAHFKKFLQALWDDAERIQIDDASSSTGQAANANQINSAEPVDRKEPLDPDLTKVTKEVLQKYLHALSEKYKVKTVKRRFACLRSLFNYMEYEELIASNPFLKFKFHIKDPFMLPASMSLTEMNKMLSSVHQMDIKSHVGFSKNDYAPNSFHFIKLRDAAILEFLFASGVRVSELCGLKMNDLHDDCTVLQILGKGNKERLVYLANEEVIDTFKKYIDYREKTGTQSEYVFINKVGKKLSTQAVRNLVSKYVLACGISKNITPHAFRHTFASLLLDEGVDIKYIQEFLGHSSITTTQIYLHTSNQRKKDIISSMHPRQKLSIGSE